MPRCFNYKKYFLLMLFTVIGLTCLLNAGSSGDIIAHHTRNEVAIKGVMSSSCSSSSREALKKIVYFGTYFGLRWEDTKIITDLSRCPESRCVISFNATEAADADAVLFHSDDLGKDVLPVTRRPDQRYVWITQENAIRPWTKYGKDILFNWTFTHHRASEIYMPYGALVPKEAEGFPIRPPVLNKTSASYKQYLQDLRNNSLIKTLALESLAQRPKNVSWMVSNCNSWSGREQYGQELKKHIDVDVYGKCGFLKCPETRDICYNVVLAPNYKFYLSFENSFCKDYLTEKVWLPLIYGIVPVVLGGAKYDDFLPPNSYIDANLMSPKELALKLKSLSASPLEYAKYFVWRRYWRVETAFPHCELCYQLHHDNKTSTVKYLKEWWTGVNECWMPK